MDKNITKQFSDTDSSSESLSSDEILEQLKCPICVDIPLAEIYQCKNGHTLCHNCLRNVKQCPHCRVSFEGNENLTRVRALESLVESIRITCPYKEVGCLEKVSKRNMNEHMKNCIFNGKCIKLCKKLGYNCDYWTNGMNPDSAATHFRNNHGAVVVNGDSVNIQMENFTGITGNLDMDCVWTPIFIKTTDGLQFIILTLFQSEDSSVSWTCLKLSQEEQMKSEIEVHIENQLRTMIPIRWKFFSIPLLELESCNVMELVDARIPVSRLQSKKYTVFSEENDMEAGNLPLQISISSRPLRREVRAQNRIMIRGKHGTVARIKTVSEIVPQTENTFGGMVIPMWVKLTDQFEIFKKNLLVKNSLFPEGGK